MADTARQPGSAPSRPQLPGRGATLSISPSAVATPSAPVASTTRVRAHSALPSSSPVTQNGSFEFDRVIKAGYVQKRTQKTKAWKSVYLVLRPNTLSVYKSDKENKLRHKIFTSELTAVTLLKDPKQKRHNLFGLYSPARNFHFEAQSARDAQEWSEFIRRETRIEEEEEEVFLTSHRIKRQSFHPAPMVGSPLEGNAVFLTENDRLASSSPEPIEPARPRHCQPKPRRVSMNIDSSGLSGNELISQSDFSDSEVPRKQRTIDTLGARSFSASGTRISGAGEGRPSIGDRNTSQLSGLNIERDPDRVVWQGRLKFLKSKRGVRQWKACWAVLRPRNLILYKDESEYTASFIIPLSSVVDVVDIDPVSKTKSHCMQIITDEKSYRMCAQNEDALVTCLGAFKSLISKRRDLEARMAANTGAGNTA